MNDSLSESEKTEATAFSQISMRAILAWLGSPPPANVIDQLMPLHCHLAALRASRISPEQRHAVLDSLFGRVNSVASTLIPTLTVASLPIPRKTRQLIRGLQDLLRAVAEDLLDTLPKTNGSDNPALPPPYDLTLWRSLYVLSLHLLISNLAASPPGVGIWRQFHQSFEIAAKAGIAGVAPRNATNSPQDIYYATILLGCAQPASFTSNEIKFVAVYLELFADLIEAVQDTDSTAPTTFWIDPGRDAPATACARKSPPPDTPIRYFSCARLARQLKKHLPALISGVAPKTLGLPDFAGTSAGHGVLRRLISHWGEPGKRRFQRRRQSRRVTLFTGLDKLWRVFQGIDEERASTSVWMVTNESPEGYAIMHVSGTIGNVMVGDITAIRVETGENWQICIVRWALSENQEHLELGLQILASNAIPAFVALPDLDQASNRVSVLILPEAPPLRSNEMLVTPSGTLDEHPGNFVLLVERESVEVHEVRDVSLDEQNSRIDVFSISRKRQAA